jgi:hypothetical protein
MRRTLGLAALTSLISIVAAPAQDAAVPFGDLVAAASERLGVECERVLSGRPLPNDLAEREAEMSAAIVCDCLPPALEAERVARGAQAPITSGEFAALFMRELDICGARAVRDVTRRTCPQFAPPGAPATYCTCFATAVDGLTDEQIVEDSIASRDNLEQRLLARRTEAPEPPLYDGLLARIDRDCRRPASPQ